MKGPSYILSSTFCMATKFVRVLFTFLGSFVGGYMCKLRNVALEIAPFFTKVWS